MADELRVPLVAVTFVMADTDLTPYDAGTFGSQTTPRMAPQLARAAATAREILLDQAAARWRSTGPTLRVQDGRIAAGRQVGGLRRAREGQKLTGTVAADAPVRPPDAWTIARQAASRKSTAAVS